MIILGYAGYNMSLRQEHIIINRTCRESTALEKGISYLETLFLKNLKDLFRTMQWNKNHDIKFYRIASDIAPHCTNPNLMNEKDRNDYTKLVYSLQKFGKYFKQIGKYAKQHNIRITFHPDLFNVLNTPDQKVLNKTFRDLHFHATIMDLMGLDTNSIMVLHGGGVYGNKILSMERWVINFNKLPNYIKRRIVLENDETGFSIEDVLTMSNSVNEFEVESPEGELFQSKVPVVFDIFHYYCYNITLLKREAFGDVVTKQKSIEDLLPIIKQTWDVSHRDMKLHISEQDPELSFGAHSDFVNTIPQELIDFSKDKKIYLMVEAKAKEEALIFLRNKYSKITT